MKFLNKQFRVTFVVVSGIKNWFFWLFSVSNKTHRKSVWQLFKFFFFFFKCYVIFISQVIHTPDLHDFVVNLPFRISIISMLAAFLFPIELLFQKVLHIFTTVDKRVVSTFSFYLSISLSFLYQDKPWLFFGLFSSL